MNFFNRLRVAFKMVMASDFRELSVDDLIPPRDPNPYADDQDAAAMMYEAMEASVHALWPLVTATDYGGLMAFRGAVYGALVTLTEEENEQDQAALAYEVARVVHEYINPDQSAVEMPGVSFESTGPGRVDMELVAFFSAARDGEFEEAVSVVSGMYQSHGESIFAAGVTDSQEEANRRVTVEFLGSVMASMVSQYVDDNAEVEE